MHHQRRMESSVPPQTLAILEEFKDVLPDDLLSIPLKRKVDHAIDIDPEGKVPNLPMYRMSQKEHEELFKQLEEYESKGLLLAAHKVFLLMHVVMKTPRLSFSFSKKVPSSFYISMMYLNSYVPLQRFVDACSIMIFIFLYCDDEGHKRESL